jgi:hypothetical protein
MQYATAGKKTITVTVSACDLFTGTPSGEISAQTTLSFDAGGSPQFVLVPTLSGSAGPLPPIQIPDGGGSITASLPYKLGQRLTLEYDSIDPRTGQLTRVPSTMTFQDQRPATNMGNISNIFSDPTKLFPDNVLLHFTDQTPDEFFAVHSGKAVLDIKPKDPSSGAPEVLLTVEVPTCLLGESCGVSLGTTHNQLSDGADIDSDIVRFADFRGIPPQILKGQIQRESNFDPIAYRYEPLTVDFAKVFPDPLFISRFPVFNPYILGPSPLCPPDFQLPQSPGLQNGSPDVTPREKDFHVQTSVSGELLCSVPFATMLPNTRKIASMDVGVTMENILFTNDRGGKPSQNWTTSPGGQRELELFESFRLLGGKPFAAQTVIASSYGLIQVLYTTAVQDRRFMRNGVGWPPSDMLIPKTAIDLGTEELGSLFKTRPVVSGLERNPQFKTYDDLKSKFGIALVYYNGVQNRRWIPGVSPLTDYATNVLLFSDSYSPF